MTNFSCLGVITEDNGGNLFFSARGVKDRGVSRHLSKVSFF